MKQNKTEIVIVLDRSGSMSNIARDSEGGLYEFIEGQKKVPGECSVTLYQFDDQSEKVFEDVAIDKVEKITITPRGSTALFDCLGRAIDEVGARLAAMPEDDRPELVIVTIISDGEENASREFTKDVIASKIKTQEEQYNWQFVFLGANFDAFATGQTYGFQSGKCMNYGLDTNSIKGAYAAVSSMSSNLRAVAGSGSSACRDISFSAEDRLAAKVD